MHAHDRTTRGRQKAKERQRERPDGVKKAVPDAVTLNIVLPINLPAALSHYRHSSFYFCLLFGPSSSLVWIWFGGFLSFVSLSPSPAPQFGTCS